MKKKKAHILPVCIIILFIVTAAGVLLYFRNRTQEAFLQLSELSEASKEEKDIPIPVNPYFDLSVPTYITKLQDTYFLVDCYHDEIIYSDSLDRELNEWEVMTDEINRGHTIASDGVVYLTDDTENNRILVFEKEDGRFIHTQTFSDIGIRPHYIVYDETSGYFYALSSMTGELYVFSREKNSTRMGLKEVRSIEKLNGDYVRSFTIIGKEIYFVSGNSTIIRARLKDLKILEEYPVSPEIAGMVQLTKIEDYYYITISTDVDFNQDYATFIRTKDLNSLASGGYEDIYDNFIGGGTPYYITSFDGHFYLTEHRIPGHSVWQFDVEENEIVNVVPIF